MYEMLDRLPANIVISDSVLRLLLSTGILIRVPVRPGEKGFIEQSILTEVFTNHDFQGKPEAPDDQTNGSND